MINNNNNNKNRVLLLRKANYLKFWQRWTTSCLGSFDPILVVLDISTAAQWMPEAEFVKDRDLHIDCSETRLNQFLVIKDYKLLLHRLNLDNPRYPNTKLALTDTVALQPRNGAQIMEAISQITSPILIISNPNLQKKKTVDTSIDNLNISKSSSNINNKTNNNNDQLFLFDDEHWFHRTESLKELRHLESLSRFTLIVFASREYLKVKPMFVDEFQIYYGIKCMKGTLIHLNLDHLSKPEQFLLDSIVSSDSLSNGMNKLTASASKDSSSAFISNETGAFSCSSTDYELRNSYITNNYQTLSFDLIHTASQQKIFYFSLSAKDLIRFIFQNYPKAMTVLKKIKPSNCSRTDILRHLLTETEEAKSFFNTHMNTYAQKASVTQEIPQFDKLVITNEWMRKLSFLVGSSNLDMYDSLDNSLSTSKLSGAFSKHVKPANTIV